MTHKIVYYESELIRFYYDDFGYVPIIKDVLLQEEMEIYHSTFNFKLRNKIYYFVNIL